MVGCSEFRSIVFRPSALSLVAMLATHGPCAPCSRVAAGGTHCLRAPVPRNEEIRNGKGVGARYRRRVECKAEGKKGGSSYFNFTGFPFPLGPFFDRKTIRKEVKDVDG